MNVSFVNVWSQLHKNLYERHSISNTIGILLHLKAAETYSGILFGNNLLKKGGKFDQGCKEFFFAT